MECINCAAQATSSLEYKGEILHFCGNNCILSYQKQKRRENFINGFTQIQENMRKSNLSIENNQFNHDVVNSKIWKKINICFNIVKDSIKKIETRKVTEKKYDMLLEQFHVVMEIYENTTSKLYFEICLFAKNMDGFKLSVLSLCQG
jgi:hypothetical protein